MKPRFTVEERADRWQRRVTGPWKTDRHSFGPLYFEHRYRFRPWIESVRLTVAVHDLEKETWRPFVRWYLRLIERAARLLD